MVDLGKEAVLSRREIIPGESFKPGDRIQAHLSEVVMTNRGPEIRLSRTSPMFLVKLFEVEVLRFKMVLLLLSLLLESQDSEQKLLSCLRIKKLIQLVLVLVQDQEYKTLLMNSKVKKLISSLE